MKVLILAGGYGSRLSEETDLRPKPMVEVGGRPIIWHIMKNYSFFGYNEFIILCGYKGYMIKEYFFNYYLHHNDISIDLVENKTIWHKTSAEPWKVTLIDTGLDTKTGGRIKRAREFVGDESFMVTYGDGVADVNIKALLSFHKSHGKYMTMTSSQPEGRFGALDIEENDKVSKFLEKPRGDGSWINAGFFVCEPEVFNYIEGDETVFEQTPLEKLAGEGQLYTYKHNGFWHPMDTLRDKYKLEELWKENPPWKLWE